MLTLLDTNKKMSFYTFVEHSVRVDLFKAVLVNRAGEMHPVHTSAMITCIFGILFHNYFVVNKVKRSKNTILFAIFSYRLLFIYIYICMYITYIHKTISKLPNYYTAEVM